MIYLYDIQTNHDLLMIFMVIYELRPSAGLPFAAPGSVSAPMPTTTPCAACGCRLRWA